MIETTNWLLTHVPEKTGALSALGVLSPGIFSWGPVLCVLGNGPGAGFIPGRFGSRLHIGLGGPCRVGCLKSGVFDPAIAPFKNFEHFRIRQIHLPRKETSATASVAPCGFEDGLRSSEWEILPVGEFTEAALFRLGLTLTRKIRGGRRQVP